jgi:hypothetical protein
MDHLFAALLKLKHEDPAAAAELHDLLQQQRTDLVVALARWRKAGFAGAAMTAIDRDRRIRQLQSALRAAS